MCTHVNNISTRTNQRAASRGFYICLTLSIDHSILSEADAAQGIGGVDYLMTSETDSKDLIDEVG